MDLMVAGLDAGIIALTLAIAMLAAWGIGTWMGHRLRSKSGKTPSKFDDASMALMGLLLAFAFGMSINKHDQRRMAVVADSNAIGDFYTCATLLKEPTRTKLQGVIREYAELRLGLSRRQVDYAELENALPRMQQAHQQMTELVAQALSDGTPIAVSLTNTLNELTSNHAARLAAVRDRLPASVVMLLVVAPIITSMLIGREQGIAGNSEVAGMLCFILLVSLAIYVTLDLNQPGRGLIRVSQEPIERLISSMPK
ncbi:MAG: hypothetical protein ABSD31_18705 [Candidatus Binataceae bacterium]|jgi:hypothetical protein